MNRSTCPLFALIGASTETKTSAMALRYPSPRRATPPPPPAKERPYLLAAPWGAASPPPPTTLSNQGGRQDGRSGFEVGHSLAGGDVERDGGVVVGDQPAAVDLLEAEGATDPHAGRGRAVAERAVEPAEAVAERHLVPHGESQVAHLVVHLLEERERSDPVLHLRLDPHVLERWLDVEGDDVRRVDPPQGVEILGADPVDDPVDLPPDLGLVGLTLRRHRICPFLSLWLLASVHTTMRRRGCQVILGLAIGP